MVQSLVLLKAFTVFERHHKEYCTAEKFGKHCIGRIGQTKTIFKFNLALTYLRSDLEARLMYVLATHVNKHTCAVTRIQEYSQCLKGDHCQTAKINTSPNFPTIQPSSWGQATLTATFGASHVRGRESVAAIEWIRAKNGQMLHS